MALDAIPTSFASDSNWTVTYVPSGSNPLSAAILNAGTAIDMTYSFTESGFNYGVQQANVPDGRLTLFQVLSRPGKVTESLTLQYVDSKDLNSAAVTLTAGLTGFFVIRRGVANGAAYAAAQVVDVISFILGNQSPDAPAANGLDTITQDAYFTASTQRKVPVVA